ncbi:MAG: hypothetical protein NTW86_15020, partial [Candidatus Sumerlaeota bacterium]|nr:hypothetical protein [Candidatus Sumerlaeota bacterium]
YFGDLHRHTDLSLCFPFYDGTLEDAYRYAIDVARLDFLGVTDHTRDIAQGDALSQLWWRCVKEVGRHRLIGTFIPYFAWERSNSQTDHNVITLHEDMLRTDATPLPELWKELDHDTFTIPHNPIGTKCWNYQNDALRPLLEIFQGYRNQVMEKMANVGLQKGYHLGFIASSDHLSTDASFACVWSPRGEREAIFRSMQARRTYGATDKIRLVFRAGDHWMGEQFDSPEPPEFQIAIDGASEIENVIVTQDGAPVKELPVRANSKTIRATYRPDPNLTGSHYYYISMTQRDGNQAWSSPIWVNIPSK